MIEDLKKYINEQIAEVKGWDTSFSSQDMFLKGYHVAERSVALEALTDVQLKLQELEIKSLQEKEPEDDGINWGRELPKPVSLPEKRVSLEDLVKDSSEDICRTALEHINRTYWDEIRSLTDVKDIKDVLPSYEKALESLDIFYKSENF